MSNIAERVSRLEGEHGHLATKAEVAELKSDLKTDIAQLESRLIKYVIVTVVGGVGVLATLFVAIERLLK